MANKCDFCMEKCPQAERAHQAALGRMYATNEFIALQKKVENGELVEVVRCKDCKYYKPQKPYPTYKGSANYCCRCTYVNVSADDFCSFGERREGE